MTTFAMVHDAHTRRRYAVNPELARIICEREDGEATLIMFDSHTEDLKWLHVAESFAEVMTEMNRAMAARLSTDHQS